MEFLPQPIVIRCYVDQQFQQQLPAMELHWNLEAAGAAERTWHLPSHVMFKGPPPTRFGITVIRTDRDSYSIRLLWNDLFLNWTKLKKTQILSSALTPLLRALGTDIWSLLEQPVEQTTKVA